MVAFLWDSAKEDFSVEPHMSLRKMSVIFFNLNEVCKISEK